jgi:hypothetical protein
VLHDGLTPAKVPARVRHVTAPSLTRYPLAAAAALSFALLWSLAACRTTRWDAAREAREAGEARAFVTHLDELSRAGRWAELSAMIDPDPRCTTAQCILSALTVGSECAAAPQGPLELDPYAVKLYSSGDGFSTSASVAVSHRRCRFAVGVNRTDGTGPFYISAAPR